MKKVRIVCTKKETRRLLRLHVQYLDAVQRQRAMRVAAQRFVTAAKQHQPKGGYMRSILRITAEGVEIKKLDQQLRNNTERIEKLKEAQAKLSQRTSEIHKRKALLELKRRRSQPAVPKVGASKEKKKDAARDASKEREPEQGAARDVSKEGEQSGACGKEKPSKRSNEDEDQTWDMCLDMPKLVPNDDPPTLEDNGKSQPPLQKPKHSQLTSKSGEAAKSCDSSKSSSTSKPKPGTSAKSQAPAKSITASSSKSDDQKNGPPQAKQPDKSLDLSKEDEAAWRGIYHLQIDIFEEALGKMKSPIDCNNLTAKAQREADKMFAGNHSVLTELRRAFRDKSARLLLEREAQIRKGARK